MVGDEGETDTHCMGRVAIIVRALGPHFLCSGENELSFSGFKHEAEILKLARRFRTADERTKGAEIFGSTAHQTIISDNGCWPGDFNSGMLSFVFSHAPPPSGRRNKAREQVLSAIASLERFMGKTNEDTVRPMIEPEEENNAALPLYHR